VSGPAIGYATTTPIRDDNGKAPNSLEEKRYGGGERREGDIEEITTILDRNVNIKLLAICLKIGLTLQ
jgi:hypothetical protein